MRKTVEKLLRRYGSRITLRRGSADRVFSGVLSHTGSRSWQNMENVYSPLGEIPRGQYGLLAPIEPELAEGDTLILDGKEYLIRRLELERWKGKLVCQWGLCVEKGGEDLWGSPL